MDDLLEIVKLESKYIDDVYAIEKSLIGDCDKKSIIKSIDSEILNYYVLLKNKKVIGFFECQILQPEIELYDIAVVQEEQGNGYAKFMMDYLLSLAHKSKCHTILLEVNNINNKAINLYNRYGFEKYFVRKNYYGDNDAIMMKLHLDL